MRTDTRSDTKSNVGPQSRQACQFRAQKSYSYEMPGFNEEIVAAARAEILGHREIPISGQNSGSGQS